MDDPQGLDVEGGNSDPECDRGELLPTEGQAGTDRLPAQPFPGEVWAQAALPIQGAVVVAATRYLAIGSERAEAGEFVLVVPLEYSIV